VGTIQKLVIVNHGGGSGPDWFVSTVKVQKSGTGAVTTFDFSQEIASGASASRTPA
jgi:hypothetical protein